MDLLLVSCEAAFFLIPYGQNTNLTGSEPYAGGSECKKTIGCAYWPM